MPTELIVIGLVGLLLFGAKKLPSLGRGLGQGLREFKREINEDTATASSPQDVREINEKNDSTKHPRL